MLSVNDLQRMGYTVAAPATDLSAVPVRVMGMVVVATAASAILSVFNATATSGTADITIRQVTSGQTESVWFGSNGVKFGTALAASVANALGYIFYVVE